MRGRAFPILLALASMAPQHAAATDAATEDEAQFRALFKDWKTAQDRQRPALVPSTRPLMAKPASASPPPQRISAAIGMRRDPILNRMRYHAGVDLPEPAGKPVYATADGTVAIAGRTGGYGLLVTIRHRSGYETRYAHMSQIAVTPGQALRRGRLIGYVGSTGHSTGPHLHYEVRLNGRAVDPLRFMRDTGAS
ncbi:M23 family metallopeptidase [Sphingobium ummariense]|uniref:M23ase beta-sheet core domain-containing protein n=1 Tax=Sphingobium ummariense RL-3 TaxID=1346791 RepID=T0J5G3_9SPHN|nr:M23 family metallopeptidase [Sphingobium ummariense]EQB33186.1 hypothetical protein M529_05170 [Sphingobium ummariense RL-3]